MSRKERQNVFASEPHISASLSPSLRAPAKHLDRTPGQWTVWPSPPRGRGGGGPLLFAQPVGGLGSRTAPLAALGDETLQAGVLRQWQLTLYGSVWSPVDIRDRQRWVPGAGAGRRQLLRPGEAMQGAPPPWDPFLLWAFLPPQLCGERISEARGQGTKFRRASSSLFFCTDY